MHQVDIGAARPIDGALVVDVSFLEDQTPPDYFIVLLDSGGGHRVRRPKGVTPEELVRRLGADDFVRIDVPHVRGTSWLRRSRIREVRPIADGSESGGYAGGSMVFMDHDQPYLGLPADKVFMERPTAWVYGVTVDEMRALLGQE